MIFYIILVILILSLTLNGFLKKSLTKEVNTDEYLFVMCHIIFLSTYIYISSKYILGKSNIRKNIFKKLDKKTILLFIFCGVNAILASALFVYLLKSGDVSYIIPHTSSLLIVCTLLIGCLFYKEKMNTTKIIGIVLILAGLTCINVKDKKSIGQSNV